MKKILLILITSGVLTASGVGLYQWGKHQGKQQNATASTPNKVDPKTGKRVLYWHDLMVPGHRFDQPGKSPFMDMELVPVYADEEEANGIRIDPRLQQNLGIRTEEVKLGTWKSTPEPQTIFIQARANGVLERLLVDRAPPDPIHKGQALAQLFIPDWVAAQEDYLTVQRMDANASVELLSAAEQRMRLVGMSEPQIALVKSSKRVHSHFTLTAPIDGILVTEPTAREGLVVTPGTPLFRITRQIASTPPRDVLQIPSEAIIRTGKRSIVMLSLEEGRFMPIEIEIGEEHHGQTEVRSGLKAGQKVVVSGQFLIDSEASLKGVETRLKGNNR